MEMHQIRYFLAVADTLNFTRAAERCHVSQPALTRHPTARRGAGWTVTAARAQADASDRFWPVNRAAFAPAPRRCRCREIDSKAVSEPAGSRDPPRRHVH